MLAYILALLVGFSSIGVYLAAFFLPEIHRKSDFYWSGVGLFYALVLWVCAGRITGGVLLGQIAGVSLLGWFGWQTLTLRRQLIPVEQQTELPTKEEAAQKAASLIGTLQSKLSNLSVPPSVAQLPQKLTGLFSKAKKPGQGAMTGLQKLTKETSVVEKTTTQPVTPPTAATGEAMVAPIPEAFDADSEAQATAPITPTPEALDADSETEATAPATPIAQETPTPAPLQTLPEIEAAETSTSIENIAPEVELAPPAEPVGLGDATDRQSAASTPPEIAKAPAPSPFSEIATAKDTDVKE
ncbi:MAG TPA: Ycf66 family protein [Leptolyngbyaceae cyanobacterium]